MATTTWTVDPTHSDVQFRIKHLVISTVTGAFNQFEGTASVAGDDFENVNATFKIAVKSIDTKNEDRDNHLRTGDFFDADSYPEIIFSSASWNRVSDDEFELLGDLTMRGTTKPIKLKAEFGGIEKDAYGNTKAGFEITGKINRKEFGLTYNALTETGGLALGEEIKLVSNIQLIKEA
ncbi:YceI family protein [Olivibacter sp. SDN3]|uniref:YceI family protein n=1 Tax=Olivibacter sp. SDN3 TaxID=2764720 RepID=UPI0016511669|nr:YceI family protein [Olivibacter sp. SDN3]QNL48612.1 YceI family protein [Olivibacter sp. SDN3]